MIMILFYSEVLVRLLSYGKNLGIANCQLLSVHQEKCLLLPVSLGAKASVLLPQEKGKKNTFHLFSSCIFSRARQVTDPPRLNRKAFLSWVMLLTERRSTTRMLVCEDRQWGAGRMSRWWFGPVIGNVGISWKQSDSIQYFLNNYYCKFSSQGYHL